MSPRPAPAPPALGQSLEFMRILWALTHELHAASKRMRSSLGVTGPQRIVIRILGRAPDLSAGALAELLQLHPSTLTGVLKRLEDRGLITRASDPADARRAVLRLTAAGRRVDRGSKHTVEAAVARALARLDEPTVRAAARALSAVIEQVRKG